jgi:hypothetical protein
MLGMSCLTSNFQVLGPGSSTLFVLETDTNQGIHGKPFIDWDNSGPVNTTGWAGYCPHGVSCVML